MVAAAALRTLDEEFTAVEAAADQRRIAVK